MSCVYETTKGGLPQCLVFTRETYRDLFSFLGGRPPVKETNELLTDEIECISFDRTSKSIKVDLDQCISCGSCAFSCPGGRIRFPDGIHALPACSDFVSRSKKEVRGIQEALIRFNGSSLDSFNKSYRSFDAYTGTKETTNISVWAGNLLRHLFGREARLGLEIPLSLEGRDRNGRLDICLLYQDTLMVIEAKVGLKKLIAEGRYVAQMLAYDEEIMSLDLYAQYKIFPIKLLLVGDSETDLLPESHELCSSRVGNLSKIFYASVLKHGLQFISARGLLSLAMAKLVDPESRAGNVLIEALRDPSTVGILSNMLIKKRRGGLVFESLILH